MTASTTIARPRAARGTRIKGVLAATAVIGFLGMAVAAPFTMPTPAAAEPEFYERIHQQFVPEVAADPAINVGIAPIEEIPKPEPVAAPVAESKPAAPPMYTGGGSPAEWMAAAGIAESDWGYVDYIVSRESGWNPNAINAAGGYCGLVQIAPMHGVANCTDPVVNLQWATGYANGRYGSWAGAYNHWATFNNGW